jgi:hypothetical protein
LNEPLHQQSGHDNNDLNRERNRAMAHIDAECIAAFNCNDSNEVFPEAVRVQYFPAMARVVVFLSSGMDVSFAPSDVLGLENAKPDELAHAQLSPSGLSVCFPELHVDLYIPGLAEGVVGSESWLAPQMDCSRHTG